MAPRSRSTLIPLLIAVLVMALGMAFGATAARASDSDMSGMSHEEMHDMSAPTPAPGATTMAGGESHDAAPAATDGHGSDATMDMSASANWLVVGGFMVLVVGATLAAAATKRHLRRRMLAGELSGAGVQSV